MTQEKTNAHDDWARNTLDKAVSDISALGIIPDEILEARALWSVPGKVMIGQARQAHEPSMFVWFISGDLPTDTIGPAAAATPREALRNFSLKWQLDAEQYRDPATRKAHGLDESHDWNAMTARLIKKAEELYAMADDDRLWHPAVKN
jgi:hypothetical protein